MNKHFLVLAITLLISHLATISPAIAAGKSVTHKHGARSHSHPLPSSGLNHSHNGAKKQHPKSSLGNELVIYDEIFSIALEKRKDGSTLMLTTTLSACKAGKGIALLELKNEKGQTLQKKKKPFKLDGQEPLIDDICARALKKLKRKVSGALYPNSYKLNADKHRFSIRGRSVEKDLTFSGDINDCKAKKGKFTIIQDSDENDYSLSINEVNFDLEDPTDQVARGLCKIALSNK